MSKLSQSSRIRRDLDSTVHRLFKCAGSAALRVRLLHPGVKRMGGAVWVAVLVFALASSQSRAQPAPDTLGPKYAPQSRQWGAIPASTEQVFFAFPKDRQPAALSADDWQSYPTYGGEMTSIVMDPVDPQTVFVGTRDAGVFKTTDGGSSWQPARQGLTVMPIRSLAIDPQHPQTLYAGTDFDGVWKSTNGGGSWFQASAGLDMSLVVTQIIIDPLNTQILYAGMGGGTSGLIMGHIFKSTDGGATWVQKDNGITIYYSSYVGGIKALAIDPAHPLTLYAGTTTVGAFRSEDGGATWTAINDGLPLGSPGSTTYYGTVNALAPDPHHANRPSALLDGGYLGSGGYYVFEDNRWQPVSTAGSNCASGLVKNYLYFHPTNPAILYCAGNGFYKSTDGGVHWERESGPVDTRARELAFHPSTPDTIYAAGEAGIYYGAVSTGGVFKSSDQGETWLQRAQGITAESFESVAIDPRNSSNIYAGSSEGYLARTSDGGLTWQDSPVYYSSVSDIAVDPLNSQKIYVAASDVYTSTDQGVTFKKVDTIRMATVIAVTPGASGPVYVGTDFGTGIYKSSDGGASWVQKNDGLPISGTRIPKILSLAVDPSNPSRVWAGLNLGDYDQPGIVRSDDGGDHWYGSGLIRWMVNAIAVDPSDGNTLLAGANYWASGIGNIYKSTDGGLTWQLQHTGAAAVTKIVFDPRDPCVAYAATEGSGVLRSISCGESWHSYSAGIFYPVLYSLAISGDNPPLLVTGSYASGLYWAHPPTRQVVHLPMVMKR
jgi:photosystem II stability/assembly factor-like uncharacterized protein